MFNREREIHCVCVRERDAAPVRERNTMRVCERDKEITKTMFSIFSRRREGHGACVFVCEGDAERKRRVCEILCIRIWLRKSERESHERAYVSERGRAGERERKSARRREIERERGEKERARGKLREKEREIEIERKR